MKLSRLALLASTLALSACGGASSPSQSSAAVKADVAVLAQLATVGAQCTPALPGPAVAACTGKAAGDACTVTREGQTVNATCGNDDGHLMCGAGEDKGGLPAVLTNPCTGKAAGDACAVTGHEHGFAGLCSAAFSTTLACLPPPPPPPPPVRACSSKATGDTCSFGDPAKPTTGLCYAVGMAAVEVCLPAPPPEPPRVAACDGKVANDACTVTHEGMTRSGTCQAPTTGPLSCQLAPPAPPQAAVDACTAHAAADACSFTWEHGETVNGACTAASDGTLVCTPACPK
jgi:hypothetical protein